MLTNITFLWWYIYDTSRKVEITMILKITPILDKFI